MYNMFIYLLYKNLNANMNRYISPILSLHIPHQFKFQACGHALRHCICHSIVQWLAQSIGHPCPLGKESLEGLSPSDLPEPTQIPQRASVSRSQWELFLLLEKRTSGWRWQPLGCSRATWNVIKTNSWDFPGGPVVKTLHSRCRGPRFNLW